MVYIACFKICRYPSICNNNNILKFVKSRCHANWSSFKCVACLLCIILLLYVYTYCMTVANSRGKRETANFASNTNFLYQCALHNSTATPRGNTTAPTRVLIIMWIIVVCVCVCVCRVYRWVRDCEMVRVVYYNNK